MASAIEGTLPRRGRRPRRRGAEFMVPDGPVDYDEVLRRFPTLRQSLLSTFDDCHLGTLFETRYAKGWSTVPQAMGLLFHRFAAECLRRMQLHDSEHIPLTAALGVMEWALDQDDVEPRDVVCLPLREIPLFEMACRKFAKDNAFTIRSLLAVERRLTHELRYQLPDGTWVTRKLTGQLDALIQSGQTEVSVLDWKNTWKLPPEHHEDSEDPGISYHGYFQQLFYAWLVMKEWSTVESVVLREFYVRRTKVRRARRMRADLPKIEEKLARLARSLDKALLAGAPPRLTIDDVEEHGYWKPSPGAHCFWCPGARLCPLSEDEQGIQPSVRTMEDAQRLAGERQVAKAIVKQLKVPLEQFADARGPIPIKDSKGRRVLGHRLLSNGQTRFEEYTPDEADRPGTRTVETPNLEAAMRKATEKARAAR